MESISLELNNENKVLEQLENYLFYGKQPKGNKFIINQTPAVLQYAGINPLEIEFSTSVINKAKKIHKMTNNEILNTIKKIADPLLVFDSDKNVTENKKESILLITDEEVSAENKPSAVSMNVDVNEINNRYKINAITSIHGRGLIARNSLNIMEEWKNKGLLKYADDKKISSLAKAVSQGEPDIQEQFLLPLATLDMRNISCKSDFVNRQEKEQDISTIATELVLEKLKAANINVITDQNEMQAILDAGIEVQKMAAHYGTNQNIESTESFNGYGVYVLSVNEENARNLALKIAAKKYGNNFYINNQPLQEFLQERNFSPYWQSVISQVQNPSNETLLHSIMTSDVKGNPVLLKEQNQLSTLCSLNLINYKREQTYLYSVEIPDNDGTNYLYYDKTIGLESAERINEELSKLGTNWKVSRNDTGNSVYFNILSNKVFNSQKQASEFLQKIGYVGMETSIENYIIFDDREMNINNRVQYMITENGEVYGFAYNGQIYADKNLMNSNVLAHEYTHLWDNYTKNENSELWERGKNLFKQTSIWNEVLNDPSYQNIRNNEDEILSECHARICGKFAQSVLERIARENGENAKNAVIDWDKEVEAFVAKEFGFAPELGSENYISDSLKNEYMQEFLSTPMKDLMNGVGFEKNIEKESKIYKSFEYDGLTYIPVRSLSAEEKEMINNRNPKEVWENSIIEKPKNGDDYSLDDFIEKAQAKTGFENADLLYCIEKGKFFMPVENGIVNLNENSINEHFNAELQEFYNSPEIQNIIKSNRPLVFDKTKDMELINNLTSVISDGEVFTQKNENLGDIRVKLGNLKHGGINHIIKRRMDRMIQHDSKSYEEAVKETSTILFLAVKNISEAPAVKETNGRFAVYKNGIKTVIGKDDNGRYVVSGFDFEDTKQEAADSIKSVNALYGYAPEFLEIYAQVGAAYASLSNNIALTNSDVNKKTSALESLEQSSLEKAAELLKGIHFNSDNYKEVVDVIKKISEISGSENIQVPNKDEIESSKLFSDINSPEKILRNEDEIEEKRNISEENQQKEKPVVKGEIKSILDNDFTGGNVKLTQDFQDELIEKGLVKPEEKFFLINEVEAIAQGTKIKDGEPFVILTIPVDDNGKKEFVQTKYYHVSALEEPQKIEQKYEENQKTELSEKNTIIYGKTKIPEFAMITQHGLRQFKDMIINSYEESSKTYLLKSEDGIQEARITENTMNILCSEEYAKKAAGYTHETKNYEKMMETQYADYFNPRSNTANNFSHNLSVFCRKEANSPLDALKIAGSLISQMSIEEKRKTKKLLNLLKKDGQTVNEVLIETYHEAIKEVPLNESYLKNKRYDKIIARPMYDTISAKGQKIDSNYNLKIGDDVALSFKINKNSGSKFSLRKENLYQKCTIVSSSKEGNMVTLMDGNKSFYDVPRDTFLKEYAKKQKVENKIEKKVHRQQSMKIEIGR